MKRITVILLFMLPLLIVGQDLNNPSTLGQRNRNQKFPKGLQIEDTTLLKGAVWLPGFTHGGDSVLTVTGGFLQLVPAGGGATGPTGAAESIIYDTLTARITANSLMPGAKYILADFASYHRVPNQFDEFGYLDTIYVPAGEPLVLTATSDSTIAKEVYSLTWPGDVVHYDPFPTRQAARGMTKGMITYRKSPEGIETSYDWRTARVRRFDTGFGFYASLPTGAGLPFSDMLTLQNIDNVTNVYIAPLADTIVERFYALYTIYVGATLDLWNNNVVLAFTPGTGFEQGNVHFNSTALNSHIDCATYAGPVSLMKNVHFENGVGNFIYHADSASLKNDNWGPRLSNVAFKQGAIRSHLRNTLIADGQFMGNFQDVYANNWVVYHHLSLADIGTTGADTLFIDNNSWYVSTAGAITDGNTFKNFSIIQSDIGNVVGNTIDNLEIANSKITFFQNNAFSGAKSRLVNFTGGLDGVTAEGSELYSSVGVITNSILNDAYFITTILGVIDSLEVYGADIIRSHFFGGSQGLVIDARDTLTGGLNNVIFQSGVSGVIGIPITNSNFSMEFSATWTNQIAAFDNNDVGYQVSAQPDSIPALYSATRVISYRDLGGSVQHTWMEGDELKGYPILYEAVTADGNRALNMAGYNWSVTGAGDMTLSSVGDLNMTGDTLNIAAGLQLDAGAGDGVDIRTNTTVQRRVEFYDKAGQIDINTQDYHVADFDTNGNYIQITAQQLKEASILVFTPIIGSGAVSDTLELPAPDNSDYSEKTIKNLGNQPIQLVTASGVTIDGSGAKVLPPRAAIRFRQYGGGSSWVITGYYEE